MDQLMHASAILAKCKLYDSTIQFGNGTASMAMAVTVLEGGNWRRLDSNICMRYRMASPSSSP